MIARQIVRGVLAIFFTIFAISMAGKMFVTVGSGEIVVKQGFIDGTLTVWTQPGVQWQNFGHVTVYKRSAQFWFSEKKDEGSDTDEAIKVRFNDGGHAMLSGSMRYDMPLDAKQVIKLHTTFGSQEAIAHELVKQAVTKSVYMTGPLMSSKESSAERRPDLLNYIGDQISHGVYRTITKQVKTPDPLTGQEKSVSVVEIVSDPKEPGGYAREDRSPVTEYGIHTWPITINSITYDDAVEKQITVQQQAVMAVQTAVANAKKAEQDTITVEQQGKAEAAKMKWAQEAEKAKAVTLAEQQRDVAALMLEKAKLDKEANIAEGEGQAEKAKLLMGANGALEQKLATYEKVMANAFANLGKQPLVPSIVIGGSSGGSTPVATDLLNMLQVKTARDLALDMSMPAK